MVVATDGLELLHHDCCVVVSVVSGINLSFSLGDFNIFLLVLILGEVLVVAILELLGYNLLSILVTTSGASII